MARILKVGGACKAAVKAKTCKGATAAAAAAAGHAAKGRKRQDYRQETMDLALKKVREEGMAIREASRVYELPRTTLQDKVHNRTPDVGKPGPKPVLTQAEEEELTKYVKYMSQIGHGRVKEELLDIVQKIIEKDGRPNPFKDGRPGKDWFKAFMARNPSLSIRTAEHLGLERAIVTPEKILKWFREMTEYFKDLDLLDIFEHPERLFNCDKSGFPLCVRTGKILAAKGVRSVYSFGNSNKSQITTMACFSAAGQYVPPLVIFPGKRMQNYLLQGADEFCHGISPNGWMDSEVFFEYIANHFYPVVKDMGMKLPIILFVDGHASHVNLETAKFCWDKGIHLYCFPSHCSHILQPCDLSFFKPLKDEWRKAVRRWQNENIGQCVTKKCFSAVFKGAYYATVSKEKAVNGFKEAGLFPLNPNAVDFSKTKPSSVLSPPSESALSSSSSSESGLAGSSSVSSIVVPSSALSDQSQVLANQLSPPPPTHVPLKENSHEDDGDIVILTPPLQAFESTLTEFQIAQFQKRYDEGYDLNTDRLFKERLHRYLMY
ncbi:uncharacterized protein LOC135496014 [Lineus longissimus]|uniref:uncharacterized protein LOC135496014 n=1 Tax=Lineus longissimus TaxID=88925 RepID=UPI00315C66F6